MTNNLTIIICAYKANTEFKLCLNQLANFGYTAENLQIYENSPVNYTFNRYILDKYKIPYINNPDGTQAETLNKALQDVKTHYALILDSDCFLRTSVDSYLQDMKDHQIQMMGEISGTKDNFHIHKRVNPCWCLIDLNFIKTHEIKFMDFNRIKASHSESFIYPSQFHNKKDIKQFYYAMGSTMYEDIINHYGIIADIGDDLPYIHIEGASWRRDFEEYKQVVENQDNLVKHMYEMFNYDEKNLVKLKRPD